MDVSELLNRGDEFLSTQDYDKATELYNQANEIK